MKLLKAGIFVMVALFTLPSSAQQRKYTIPLADNARYFQDASNQFSIDTIISASIQNQFSDNRPTTDNGFVWIRLEMPTQVAAGSYCFFNMDVDYKELYYQENAHWRVEKNGAFLAPSERSVPQNPRYICFTFTQEQPVVYLKVSSQAQLATLLRGLVLQTSADTQNEIKQNTNLSYWLSGAMLMVILCSLAFYIFMRDSSFLLFAVFLTFFFVMVNKVFLSYLWGDHWPFLFLNRYINQLYFILTPLTLLVFAKVYFMIDQQSVFWKRVFNVSLLLALPCLFTLPLSDSINSMLILFYNVVVALVISYHAWIAYFKMKFEPALYFLLGYLVPLVAVGLIVINYFGVLSIPNLNLMADFSVLTLSFILAIGVMQRFRQTQSELLEVTKAKMSKEYEAELFKVRNAELIKHNKVIEEQRRQIEDQATSLKELNATKDKLLSIVSHDLLGPVGNLRFIISRLSERQMTPDQFHSLSEKLRKDVENSHTILTDVLGWVKTQREGIVTNPTQFDMIKLAHEVTEVLGSQSKTKGISMEVISEEETRVFADRDQVHIILRNFLTNAIKFGKVNSKIFVQVKTEDGHILVSVEDQGVGISPDAINKILLNNKIVSTPGTMGEKGTGLGLLLCKEFIDKNKGKFYIQSVENKGTIVSFSLPKA